MKPVINKTKCTNCGACLTCPVKHFKKVNIKGSKFEIKVNSLPEAPCIGCEACVINCPNEAITLEDED